MVNEEDRFEVPGLGELELTSVLEYFDGPKIVALKAGATGQLCLAYWLSQDAAGETWLLVPMTETRFRALVNAEVDLRSVLSNPEFASVAVMRFRTQQAAPEVEWRLGSDERHLPFLPSAGHYLRGLGATTRVGTEADLLISKNLQDSPQSDLAQLMEAPSDRDTLRAMVAEVHAHALATRRETVRIRFFSQAHELPSRLVSEVIRALQVAVEGFAHATAGNATLNLRAALPSSFALEFVAERQGEGLYMTSRVGVGLATLFRLFQAGRDRERLRAVLGALPKHSAGRYRRVVQSIDRAATSAAFAWGSPVLGDAQVQLTGLTRSSIVETVGTLAEFEREDTAPRSLTGRLTAFHLRRMTFELEQTVDGRIAGDVAESAMQVVESPSVGQWYRAEVSERIDLNEATGEERVRKVLEKLEPFEGPGGTTTLALGFGPTTLATSKKASR
jgi:hypothetical protein